MLLGLLFQIKRYNQEIKGKGKKRKHGLDYLNSDTAVFRMQRDRANHLMTIQKDLIGSPEAFEAYVFFECELRFSPMLLCLDFT